MSKTVSTRLEDDIVSKLDNITKKEKIDRSSLIRKFILEQIAQYEMRRVGELYRKGLVSLQEAATQANVTIYEMMDFLQKEKIRPPLESSDEISSGIEKSLDLMKDKSAK